ncbi:glycoside hydrolase family 3 N-terminal domain-containing protein [Arenicella sp. 4NH20-0111]|uniref:glycoside hydrolase family 3 N-terminal domain-containing protein n=1 Tax=Arenicella sp. 4NH20-0111 TaxID=3127648 RepID=UPI00310A3BDD
MFTSTNNTLFTSAIFVALFLTTHLTLAQEHSPPRYKDSSLSTPERVKDLLSEMTLEEKVSQMMCVWQGKRQFLDTSGNLDTKKMETMHPNGIGCIARPQDIVGLGDSNETPARDAASSVALTNAIQKYATEETRLGIPVLFHEEGLHGFQAKDATSFPQSIALASTWNTDLIEQVYAITAREIRARGVHHVLSPVIDVARDPRWGRIEETFGEDPHLVSRMGVAAVKGFQGRSTKLEPGKVFTTLKHMTGHGQPESGTNIAPSNISTRVLREVFFPPFEAAIKEANAASVMASYNEIDGVPSHGSKFLLRDVLRKEWGFQGLVVSDYFAIEQLKSLHHITDTNAGAAVIAHGVGVDLELPDPAIYPELIKLVKTGKYPESSIDESVGKILTLKFNAGLFESPYADAEFAELITGNQEARDLALKAAHQSITLLKNDNSTLPLDVNKGETLAVIGPNAEGVVLGGYSDQPRQTVSILEGIKNKVADQSIGSSLSKSKVLYAEGVRITENASWKSWGRDEVVFADRDENLNRIKSAVNIAKQADKVILVVGGNEATSREAYQDNHLGDRSNISLIGEQQELFDALYETGKPIIVVLINGRPLAITDISEKAPAIIEGWILGQETGTAVADVLFGSVNPSGKLPVTIPRSVGHLPAYYNYKPSARRGYVDSNISALYPFGFGLSYTTFNYAAPTLSKNVINKNENVSVSVVVKNSGDMAGDEIIQLYVRDRSSSVTRPVKELKAFKRVSLNPGESKTVSIEFNAGEALAFYDINMQRVVEPGIFDIMIGPDSENLDTLSLEVR